MKNQPESASEDRTVKEETIEVVIVAATEIEEIEIDNLDWLLVMIDVSPAVGMVMFQKTARRTWNVLNVVERGILQENVIVENARDPLEHLRLN